MSKQTYGIDSKTFEKWKNGFKKKKNSIFFNPTSPITINPSPVISPSVNVRNNPIPPAKKDDDLAKAFESLFNKPDPNRPVIYDKDIWRVAFPKVAEDLIDQKVFKSNVENAVLSFIRVHFPIDIEVAEKVQMRVECVEVSKDEYSHYPIIQFKPIFEGPSSALDEFLKPFHQWSGHELYWKGSFLKNKITNKITGMRLTGLAYNVPDKFIMDQPISYVEKSII